MPDGRRQLDVRCSSCGAPWSDRHAAGPDVHAGMTLGEAAAEAIIWIRLHDPERWESLGRLDRDHGGMLVATRLAGGEVLVSLAGVELVRVSLGAPGDA